MHVCMYVCMYVCVCVYRFEKKQYFQRAMFII